MILKVLNRLTVVEMRDDSLSVSVSIYIHVCTHVDVKHTSFNPQHVKFFKNLSLFAPGVRHFCIDELSIQFICKTPNAGEI